MTILKLIEIQGFDSLGKRQTTKRLQLSCDNCGKTFEKSYRKRHYHRMNFCGTSCKETSKELQKKITKTNDDLYGGRGNASALLREKGKSTCLEVYGVDHPWKSKEIQEKQRETMEREYGGSGFGSEVLMKQIKKTLVENFGADHPMRSDEIKEQRRLDCQEKNGVDHHFSLKEVCDKRDRTLMDRYGVDNAMKIPEVVARMDFVEANRKRRETLMKEDRLWTSIPETELGEWLVATFGENDVKRQSWIARHSVDFYVVSLDTFIELDGVYYHGLMGEEHLNEKIRRRRDNDRHLDEWISRNEKKLFRLTDLQWNEVQKTHSHSYLFDQLSESFVGVTLFDHSPSYPVVR